MMAQSEFISDIKTIRANARKHMEDGAVTSGYSGDRGATVKMLNAALATEILCTLRYKQHYFQCSGLNAHAVAQEFLEHSQQEQEHADWLAERITQLDGKPEMNPDTISDRAHSEYVEADGIEMMIQENLVAERIAIDSYREMINYLGSDDPTTRRIIEDILAVEEEHAEDLASLLYKN
jgi:bacterioferritin